MMNGDIYLADLQNRFPSGSGYTINETARGDMYCCEVVNGVINGKHECGSRDDAIWNVRFNLVGSTDVLAKITTVQRDAATGLVEGQEIWNTTTAARETYIGGAWV